MAGFASFFVQGATGREGQDEGGGRRVRVHPMTARNSNGIIFRHTYYMRRRDSSHSAVGRSCAKRGCKNWLHWGLNPRPLEQELNLQLLCYPLHYSPFSLHCFLGLLTLS